MLRVNGEETCWPLVGLFTVVEATSGVAEIASIEQRMETLKTFIRDTFGKWNLGSALLQNFCAASRNNIYVLPGASL